MWKVELSKAAAKSALKMPKRDQDSLRALIEDLKVEGPIQPSWPNYSKLGQKNITAT